MQPDGKVLVIGPFTNVNGIDRINIARFNPDGSVDATFDGGDLFRDEYGLVKLALLKDGSILVGGNFGQFSGSVRHGLAHLSSTGALLPDFIIPGGISQSVQDIIPMADGGAIVFGGFSSGYAIRFNAAGEVDPTFVQNSATGGFAWGAVMQPDGKIVVNFGSVAYSTTLIRLFPDGTLDPSFYEPTPAGINALAVLPNGDILAGGYFQFLNGWPVHNLVRLRGGEYTGAGIFDIDRFITTREDAGSIKVKIHRRWSTKGQVTVRFTTRDVPDGAVAGINYLPVDTVIDFADGQSEFEISIPLINTPQFDSNVWFEGVLQAESPDAAVSPTGQVAQFVITDDQPFISLRPESWVYEGGEIHMFVDLLGPTNNAATVDVVTDAGTAVPGVDYTPISTTVQLNDDNRSVLLRVPVANNDIPNGTKTVRFTLKNPQGATVTGSASVDVEIREFADVYRIDDTDVSATQDDGAVTIRLLRDTTWMASPIVRFAYKTEDGTASAGVEYVAQQGELEFLSDDPAPKTITIPLPRNNIVGPASTFRLNFTLIEGEAALTNPVATITLEHPAVVIAAGSLDPAFKPLGPTGAIYSLARTPQFIYIVGEVPDAPNVGRGFFRYNLDGTYDATFQPTVIPQKLFALSDGTLMANIPAAYPGSSLRRLTPDGAVDTAFQPDLPSLFDATSVVGADNGKVLISGIVYVASVWVPYFTQLLPDGQVDSNFTPGKLNGQTVAPSQMLRQPDGRIIVAGAFSDASIFPLRSLARLYSDGEIDSTFDAPPIGPVYQVYLQPNGKLFASGTFQLAPDHYASIVRFNADGSLDTTFAPPSLPQHETTLEGVDDSGRAYYRLNKYDTHGFSPHSLIERILPDGQVDAAFHADPHAGALVFTPDGILSMGNGSGILPLLSRLYAEPPAALGTPEISANGRLALPFTFTAGAPYVLERTSDFVTWTQVSTGTSDTGYVRTETDLPGGIAQFYRLRKP